MMLACPNCGREQEQGKFCGNCGSALGEVKQGQAVDNTEQMEEVNVEKAEDFDDKYVASTEASAATTQTTRQDEMSARTVTNETQTNTAASTSNVQASLKDYWNYSLRLLKRPGEALHEGEGNFVYGIISMLLYALTFGLIISSIFNKQLSYFSEIDFGWLVQIVFYVFLTVAISLFILVVCLLIAEKISVKKISFKTIIAQFGGLLIPFVYLHVATLLFSFVGASLVTMLLLYFSIFLVTLLLPAIYIYDKTVYYQSTPHKIYTAIGTVLLIIIAFFIVTVVFGMSAMENMLEMIEEIFYYL